MGHSVKCLGKVQQDYISLTTKSDAFRPVVYRAVSRKKISLQDHVVDQEEYYSIRGVWTCD